MFFLLAAMTFSPLDVQPRELPDVPRVAVINSAGEWKKFAVNPPSRIDFEKHTVLVVFAGERPTGGWSVRVTRVEKRGSHCTVDFAVKGPPRGSMVTQVITHPHTAILLDGKCASATSPQVEAPPRI